jgi:putative peptidoglycan lipid II flippase
MSIAAAELPELARERSNATEALRERATAAARRVSFFVVPSFVAFVVLGQVIVAGIYRAGEFGAADVTVVWLTLAAYSMGLLASTSTRIYQSAFFALRDTKTPARVAGVRVLAAAAFGSVLMIQFEPITIGSMTVPAGIFGNVRIAGLPLGPVGLALGAAAGAWIEWALLYRGLDRRLGTVGAGGGQLARMFVAAFAAAAVGYGVRIAVGGMHPSDGSARRCGIRGRLLRPHARWASPKRVWSWTLFAPGAASLRRARLHCCHSRSISSSRSSAAWCCRARCSYV